MEEISQFVHTLNYGDAISGEAVAIRQLLSQWSIANTIYSVHAHEKMKQHCKNYQQFEAGRALILHYSIGSPLNEVFYQTQGVKKVLIYHNLTPEKYFLGYNTRVVRDLRQGRQELPRLLSACDLVLADSSYNKQELDELGYPMSQVLPLPLDISKWSVPANPGIARALRGHGGKNFLHVGRLAPNKCIEDIIKSFYFYHHKINQKSRLWLIGIDCDTEIYSFELRRLISELRLKEAVTFVGSVHDGELRAFYENSDLYLCMSEHEGFCLPLVEAMYFGLPVIAYNACATGETLGTGGLLLEKKAAAEIAELMNLVIEDSALREALIHHGKQRAAVFTSQSFQEQFKRCCLDQLVAMPPQARMASGS